MKVTCYACVTIEECCECGQEVEREGVTYTYEEINNWKEWTKCVLYDICPVCLSHRVEYH